MSTIEDELDERLATRIRLEREQRGWSLDELARRSGVSRAMISKIERRQSSPTAALLGRLSTAYELTLSQLLARSEQGGGRLAHAAQQPVWRDPETGFLRRALTPYGAPTPLELVWGELPPAVSITYPEFVFASRDQQIVVLEGHLRFVQGDTVYELAPGDCLHLGAAAESTYHNPGTVPCRYIIAVLRRWQGADSAARPVRDRP
jgi:transcriptional regulator with XRE-family HTH domain